MGSFSLYIHIPYCQAKCPYCDFNSYAAVRWPEQDYVTALGEELRHYAAIAPWKGGEITTVFFGGGTPSLFSPSAIGAILAQAAALWPLAAAVEVTLEANPGTVSPETLAGFRAAGINRVSFGVQSFKARHLQTLGRIHGGADAVAAVLEARAAGFENVNVDVIFALPEQTLEEWEDDLAQVCALETDHVSVYNLTYEEGTPFFQWRAQGKLRQLPEEVEVAMFTRAQEVLGAAGYRQYEISNYARAGRACRHNLNYWRSGPYLGVGAGAHSYALSAEPPDLLSSSAGVPPALSAWGRRWSNEKNPNTYLRAVHQQGHACTASEALDARQARGEFAFLGLRCLDGISATEFQRRFGAELPAVFPHVHDLVQHGLLDDRDGRWRLTARGVLLADSVFATFL
jgi:putative oxygen-independent coproporphyrinogen III oxidase